MICDFEICDNTDKHGSPTFLQDAKGAEGTESRPEGVW